MRRLRPRLRWPGRRRPALLRACGMPAQVAARGGCEDRRAVKSVAEGTRNDQRPSPPVILNEVKDLARFLGAPKAVVVYARRTARDPPLRKPPLRMTARAAPARIDDPLTSSDRRVWAG